MGWGMRAAVRIFQGVLILALVLVAVDSWGSMKNADKRLRAIDLAKLEFTDLCDGTTKRLDLRSSSAKLWSIGCANCLWQIQNTTPSDLSILINVDRDPRKACEWIRRYKISMPSYFDSKHVVMKHMGGELPLPASLRLDKGRISEVQFGYWR